MTVYEKIARELLADRLRHAGSMDADTLAHFQALEREMIEHETDMLNQRNDGIASDVNAGGMSADAIVDGDQPAPPQTPKAEPANPVDAEPVSEPNPDR